MTLYYAPRSRALRPRWLLEELGVEYELVRLDLRRGQHRSPAYLSLVPHGVVPALVDGSIIVFESAAICLHLADRYPDKKLAPPLGTEQRALYYQWMVFAVATLEPPFVQVHQHTVGLPRKQRSKRLAREGREHFAGSVHVLERALVGRKYLLGEFTAADVMVGSVLAWAKDLGLDLPRSVDDYAVRLIDRPAFRVAWER